MKTHDNSILTKKQLLAWLNDLLQLEVRTIDELSNGAAFCQLLDIISSGDVRMQKVNWNAKLQHQNLNNLKILSTSMLSMGMNKKFNAQRISQRKTQDILELLQWFRKYFIENKVKNQNYDPQSRRRINTQRLNNQIRRSVDIEKKKNRNSTKRMQVSIGQKREPQDLISEEDLKHCFKINLAIQRIIQAKAQRAEDKLELIKTLLFKKNTSTGQKTQKLESLALSSSSNSIKKQHVEYRAQSQVKIQGNLQQIETMTANTRTIKTSQSIKKNEK